MQLSVFALISPKLRTRVTPLPPTFPFPAGMTTRRVFFWISTDALTREEKTVGAAFCFLKQPEKISLGGYFLAPIFLFVTIGAGLGTKAFAPQMAPASSERFGYRYDNSAQTTQ